MDIQKLEEIMKKVADGKLKECIGKEMQMKGTNPMLDARRNNRKSYSFKEEFE